MIDPRHIEVVPILTVHATDALSALRQMPDESVQCVVTSPPYWSLRDYGIESIIWDETVECEHEFIETRQYQDSPIRSGGEGVGFHDAATTEQRWRTHGECSICGAWRGSLGLEPTPDLYVQHLVQIFREARRVLRKDGTVWLNIGDSYAGGGNGGGGSFAKDGIREPLAGTDKNIAGRNGSRGVTVKSKHIPRGSGRWGSGNAPATGDLKAKDLVGIPWMVAFALRADGWYLRSDIIWSKPNPMPESVTDRPTRAHEYLFLLSKSQRYYYDADAIAEPGSLTSHGGGREHEGRYAAMSGRGDRGQCAGNAIPARLKQRGHSRPHDGFNKSWDAMSRAEQCSGTRNKRTVWEIATRPFPDAHFATFPPDLVTPCILAGSKAGDTVLDLFAGSGTTGKVAIELGRKAILIEPNPEYVKMIEKRTQTTMGLPL